jgi:hypothetical protein
MFVLKKNPVTWWPVKVKWPDDKVAGREITWEFDIEVKLLDQAAIEAQEAGRQAIIDQFAREAAAMASGDLSTEANKGLAQRLNDYATGTFLDVVTNWRNVWQETEDEKGKVTSVEVPFTNDLFLVALAQPRVRAGIQEAVTEAINGGARAKN